MTTVTAVQPAWAQDGFLRAVWVATSETPEWIAARTDALLTRLGSVLGVISWQTEKGARWEGPPGNLAAIVRHSIVRDRATADDPDGEAIPEAGYMLSLLGVAKRVELTVRISAGCIAVGRRVPTHHLAINLRETVDGSITSEVGNAICEIVAQEWNPSYFKLTNSETNSLARRGNWKIGVGYRTWISAEVGTVKHLVDTLTSTELAGGTLISAPDDWPAARVVEAVTATLRENGLDEVPH
ncbi:hypothetical protein [Mycobacteroides chelonae]|uniref:hypothetical protein n=1 Tax=Mycobacteroides chelonae TaxID=1774 RepID=UPI003AAD17BE